ncbi:MAG: hypothetical protein EXR09_11290 [Acetobacteraceae bacterium]|nr:hypothetical protein [Acetobacteraceae bacterium]
MLDMLVIRAGMLGIAAAGAVRFKDIHHNLLVDQSAPGREGPWTRSARLDFLRSPKYLPGPCLGIPSQTFRAWYETTHGADGWGRLYKIPNQDWRYYLSLLQRMLALPIRHRTAITRLITHADYITAVLDDSTALPARRVVPATGRGGAGVWRCRCLAVPDRAVRTNASMICRFARQACRDIGGGNFAWDHVATALEAGVARVDLYARRKVLPQVNRGRGSAHPGFMEGWTAFDAADR